MMAKPKHGRLDIHPAPISPPRPHHASPSPALLSALAVIATAPSVVAGAPVSPSTEPPDFLCPFIQPDTARVHPRANVPSTSAASPTVSSNCAAVADKYIQGTDSLWRKTDTWTLYGSTCWASTTATPSAGPSRSNSSQTPTTPTPTANFDTSVLPAGWNGVSSQKSNTDSTIIFALAIFLASSICILVIGCVVWRRRKKKAKDVERKLGHRPHNNPQDHVRERNPRDKMRQWARATARWKTNIRQSARRRRWRQVPPANRPLSPTFSDSSQLSVLVQTRRGSIEPDPSRREANSDGATSPPAIPHDSPPALPPTYGASYLPSTSTSRTPNSAASIPWSTPLHVAPDPVQRSTDIDDQPFPYVPPTDGHVATDDKSRLARFLASSPPTTLNTAGTDTMLSVSAPEWHEVEDGLENLNLYLCEPTPFHDDLPPPFPPPPSKADVPLTFGYLDNHPLHYGQEDDVLVSLPVSEASGPPPGAFSTAPPFDDLGLEPSAPSLESEDELSQDWERASSFDSEVLASADPDCTLASTSSISSSVSPTPLQFTPEFAARNGIPPRYHP